MVTIAPEIVDIVNRTPTGGTPVIPGTDATADRLRRQLEMIIVRCPYKFCGSDRIVFGSANLNVGEFSCEKCGLPFRVSNAGDIYLYDAGVDIWERTTQGMFPNFFQEEITDDVIRCPYKLCRSDRVKFRLQRFNFREYACEACSLPFRVMSMGDIYLYDAGINKWEKIKIGEKIWTFGL